MGSIAKRTVAGAEGSAVALPQPARARARMISRISGVKRRVWDIQLLQELPQMTQMVADGAL